MNELLKFAADVAIKLTRQQAIAAGINPDTDEQQGELKHIGPWQIPISYKAVCIDTLYEKIEHRVQPVTVTIFGPRTMTNVRQGGYELEGFVSIKGKKYTCFTSSKLFEVEGKLINVAVISARFTPYPRD